MEKITVLVPTLNRAETLRHTLKTCIRQNDDNFEILVSNNCSIDATPEVIEEFARLDSRVRSISPERKLGMPEHWDFALGHIESGKVMIIGDDDGLMPDALPRLREVLSRDPKGQYDRRVVQWCYSGYYYPDLPDVESRYRLPSGHLSLCIEPGFQIRSSKEMIEKFADCKISCVNLVGAYHGLVDIDILNQIKQDTGRIVHSVTADVFLNIALSGYVDNFLYLHKPISIGGMSATSIGFNQLMPGEHKRSIPKEHLESSNIKFHPDVPYLPNILILSGEAFRQAKDIGLIGDEVGYNWRRAIAIVYRDILEAACDNEEKQLRLDQLSEICRACNLEDFFRDFKEGIVDIEVDMESVPPDAKVFNLIRQAEDIARVCELAQSICFIANKTTLGQWLEEDSSKFPHSLLWYCIGGLSAINRALRI